MTRIWLQDVNKTWIIHQDKHLPDSVYWTQIIHFRDLYKTKLITLFLNLDKNVLFNFINLSVLFYFFWSLFLQKNTVRSIVICNHLPVPVQLLCSRNISHKCLFILERFKFYLLSFHGIKIFCLQPLFSSSFRI